MRILLLTILLGVPALAQVTQTGPVRRVTAAPTACTYGVSGPVVYQGALYQCTAANTYAVGISAGAATASGLTMATARLLGRTTASSGAVEEISVGASLNLSGGSLNAIQDIRTTASPTFAGATITGGAVVGSGSTDRLAVRNITVSADGTAGADMLSLIKSNNTNVDFVMRVKSGGADLAYWDIFASIGGDFGYFDVLGGGVPLYLAKNSPTNTIVAGVSGAGFGTASITSQVQVQSTSSSKVAATFSSAASPSADILQATVNGSTTAGAYWGVAKNGTQFGVQTATTATAGGTTTLDLSAGNFQKVTMGAGNTTIALSNIPNSATVSISVIQDATGGRTVTWPASVKWVGGGAPTLSTGAGKRDQFAFWCDGTSCLEQSRALDVR